EACLELRDTGWIVGMQDLGAAGLTSSSVESAHRGHAGMDIDVMRAPQREAGMTAYDMMLSESQERMLVIVKRGHEDDVRHLFERWGLRSEVIGEVIAEPVIRVREHEAVAAEIPTALLTDAVPAYTREGVRPAELDDLWAFDPASLEPDLPGPRDTLLRLLASPDLCSREDVTRTYDTMVGTNTVIGPGTDAAVLRIRDPHTDRDTGRSIAVSTDGNGRITYLDPRHGGALAVAEAARNVACAGATPVALTDCLNFGNPEKPEVYYQLAEAIDGMAEAARVLETPVISGNVSLYNESYGKAIYPTPVVGMLGVLASEAPTPSAWQREGDVVALLGPWRDDLADLGGSTYLAVIHGLVAGRPPRLDLAAERVLQRLLVQASAAGLLASAHDCSDGGLAVALAEACIWSGMGLRADDSLALPAGALSAAALLFGEAPSRVVVSCQPGQWEGFVSLAAELGVPVTRLGVTEGDRLSLGALFDAPVKELADAWHGGLRVALGRDR
ncbi:MAG TPA: AIR synthase-related protein, partial [Ktedonobacterales bacterium]